MQRENLYKEVLYTITHKLGNAQNSGQGNLANHFLQMQQKKPNALSAALAPLWQTVTSENKSKQPSKDDLLTYAQEAFDIDDETHSKLMEEVKEEKVFKTLYPVLLWWAQKSNIWEFKNSIKIEFVHQT